MFREIIGEIIKEDVKNNHDRLFSCNFLISKF